MIGQWTYTTLQWAESLRHNADVMLISETHFSYTHTNLFRLPKYTACNTADPYGNSHGGKSNIIQNPIRNHRLNIYRKKHLRALSVIIENLQKPITVGAIWYLPRSPSKKQNFFGTWLAITTMPNTFTWVLG